MRVGYFTMPLHPPGSDFSRTLNEDIEQIVTLDQLGYEEAWIGEHFTSAWENIPAPDLFIAKTLALTEKIILGTGVTCMPNHNPFIIAHRIAQLDHMAHGRFYWGVGSGSLSSDFKAFGLDPATGIHRSMTRDAIDQVLQLWEDPRPGLYEHKYWRFTVPEPVEEIGLYLHIKPFQKPHPPIGVAGASPKSDTLVLAGERGWIPMSINLVPTPILQSHWEAVEEGADRTGIVPDRSVWRVAREVFIADTDKEARKEALEGTLSRDFRQYFLPLLAREKLLGLMKSDPDMADSDVTLEYLVDNVWIVGSPDTVTEKLRELYDDLGGFGVLLAMGHEWQPKDKWIDSMTWLIEEVMPRLPIAG